MLAHLQHLYFSPLALKIFCSHLCFIQDFDIPIEMQDERLSSLTAKKSLIQQKIKTGHNKHFIDSTAAAIFLQQYLDSKIHK